MSGRCVDIGGIASGISNIIKLANNTRKSIDAMRALMSVYYSGSIGVQLYRILMIVDTSKDMNEIRAAKTEFDAMVQMGMLYSIREYISGIIGAVMASLGRM